jgi:hypothetical protein
MGTVMFIEKAISQHREDMTLNANLEPGDSGACRRR